MSEPILTDLHAARTLVAFSCAWLGPCFSRRVRGYLCRCFSCRYIDQVIKGGKTKVPICTTSEDLEESDAYEEAFECLSRSLGNRYCDDLGFSRSNSWRGPDRLQRP